MSLMPCTSEEPNRRLPKVLGEGGGTAEAALFLFVVAENSVDEAPLLETAGTAAEVEEVERAAAPLSTAMLLGRE